MSHESPVGRLEYLKSLFDRSIGTTAFNKVDAKLEQFPIPTAARKIASGVAAITAFAAPVLARGFESRDQSTERFYRFPTGLTIDLISYYGAHVIAVGLIMGSTVAGIVNAENASEVSGYVAVNGILAGRFISNMLTHHLLNWAENKSITRSRMNSI